MRALAGVSVLFWLVPAVLAQGPVLVHGGGGDVREAYDWFVAQVPSKQVIVLDYTGDPGIPTVRRLEASGAQVRYLPVASRTAAQDSSIVQAVRAADALFFPGGNQYRYVQRWADTPLQRAIQAAHRRGAAIGGTSAGAMILGEVVFDARDGTVTTPDALDDPMGIPLLDGFLNILPGFIVDTHFAERGRIGRLAAWLAQRTVRHPTRFLEGLGVDTDTAVAIEPDGTMTVFGDGTLTLLGQPLSGIDVEDGLDARELSFDQFTAGFRLRDRSVLEAPPSATERPYISYDRRENPVVFIPGDALQGVDALIEEVLVGAEVNHTVHVIGEATAVVEEMGQLLEEKGRDVQVWALDAQPGEGLAAEVTLQQSRTVVLLGLAQRWREVVSDETDLGRLVRARNDAGALVVFAGAVAERAPSWRLTGDVGGPYAAYEGALQGAPGAGWWRGGAIIGDAFGADRDRWANQQHGWVWLMAAHEGSHSILALEGASVQYGWAGITEVSTHGTVLMLREDAPSLHRWSNVRPGTQVAAHTGLELSILRMNEPVTHLHIANTERIDRPAQPPLRVYPNPASSVVSVAGLHAEAPADVRITDILGRAVLQTTVAVAGGGFTLDLPLVVRSGVYGLRVVQDGRERRGLFVVQR